jgi:hypothetical protein
MSSDWVINHHGIDQRRLSHVSNCDSSSAEDTKRINKKMPVLKKSQQAAITREVTHTSPHLQYWLASTGT